MANERGLCLRNRQRDKPVDLPRLRRIIRALLRQLNVQEFDLAVHLVGEAEMTRINETRLRHAGCTDVITFDYSGADGPMIGEIFVCVSEALAQAARYRASWQAELARYIVHGVLHLLGHDDLRAPARREMRREENRLIALLDRDFGLSNPGRKRKLRE